MRSNITNWLHLLHCPWRPSLAVSPISFLFIFERHFFVVNFVVVVVPAFCLSYFCTIHMQHTFGCGLRSLFLFSLAFSCRAAAYQYMWWSQSASQSHLPGPTHPYADKRSTKATKAHHAQKKCVCVCVCETIRPVWVGWPKKKKKNAQDIFYVLNGDVRHTCGMVYGKT